jgi:zinc protease
MTISVGYRLHFLLTDSTMDLTTITLDNGLDVIIHSRPTAPVVACNVWIGAGSADEDPEVAGVAHVHEHMLFKGTQKRGVGEIAREVESSGGRINAFTSFDHTCYFVVMSSMFAETGVEILSDAVRNSTFDAGELDNELEVIREEIKRLADNPSRMATQRLFENAYQSHPYRRPIIGTDESVSAMSRDNVVDFYNQHYVPENMAFVLVGDIDTDKAKQLAREYFGDDWGDSYTAPSRPSEPSQTEFRAKTQEASVQETQLRLGFHIPDALDEDIPAIDLLSAILGRGDASHLVQTVERQKGWVNDIAASAYTPEDEGLLLCQAAYQIDGDVTDAQITGEILREMFLHGHTDVPERAIERARNLIESQEVYGKQTAQGLAMKMGHYQMVAGDPRYEQQYYDDLAEVTPADIQRVADRYLRPDNCTAVIRHPEGREVRADALETAAHAAFEEAEKEAAAAPAAIQTDDDQIARVELPDGPEVLVQVDPSVETFSIRALALGGLRFESPDQAGVSTLLSNMLTRGTHARSAMDIAREVESMAGSINGLSGRNTSGLTVNGLARHFEQSFEIAADCLRGSTVPQQEFEREKQQHLDAIRSRREDLSSVNSDRFRNALFGDHPYARPSTGYLETVDDLTPEDVRQFGRSYLRPSEMVLSVVGDVSVPQVLELSEQLLVDPESDPVNHPEIPSPPDHDERIVTTGELDKEQAHIIVGQITPTLRDPDHYALRVLDAILSGQGGRLFYELRDRQSLAYSVGANLLLGLDTGGFAIQIGTSPDKIGQALDGIHASMNRLREEGVTDDELDRARRYLIGNHDIGLQQHSARALALGLDELYQLGFKRSLQFRQNIESVDMDDVHRVIDRHLDPSRAVTAITHPPQTDLPQSVS